MDNVIVNEYMARKYPNKQYSIAKGNNCVWVMMNNINIRFDMTLYILYRCI